MITQSEPRSPRAAENELKKAEVIEPRNINLEVEQAWTALTLQEWQQAAVLTHDVVEDIGTARSGRYTIKRTVILHKSLQSFVSLAGQELMPKARIVVNMMST